MTQKLQSTLLDQNMKKYFNVAINFNKLTVNKRLEILKNLKELLLKCIQKILILLLNNTNKL